HREEVGSAGELLGDRVEVALALLDETRARWRWLNESLDSPLASLVGNAPPAYAQVIENALASQASRAARREPAIASDPSLVTQDPSPDSHDSSPVTHHSSPVTLFELLQDYRIRVSWKTELCT